MANLTETPNFDSGVYRIETSDQVLGGEAGIANKAAKNLANRTSWLKQAVDTINTFIGTLKSAATRDASSSYLAGNVPLWDGLYTKAQIDAAIAGAPVNDHQQVIGNSLITGSGAIANMPDMGITFAPKGGHILALFSAPFHTSDSGHGSSVTCYINIEGSNVASQQIIPFSNDQIISLQWMAAVSPGVSINVKATWNANSNITQHGELSPRVLTIIDLP